jgi:5-(carboxyamino)imidazole ribonucleotide mutase
MTAAHTPVPVLGVPVESRALKGLDSLLSIAQMPAGVPVGTLAIGQAGAANAGLLAVAILSNTRPALRGRLNKFRTAQTDQVLLQKLTPAGPLPRVQPHAASKTRPQKPRAKK